MGVIDRITQRILNTFSPLALIETRKENIESTLIKLTPDELLSLLAHKLKKQDKMLAVVEMEDYEVGNDHFMVADDYGVLSKSAALIIYNGGGE